MYFKETKIFNEKEAKKITDYKIVDVNEKCAIVLDENSGLYGVVSLDGKTIIEARYSKIEFLNNELFKVYDVNLVSIYNSKGQAIVPNFQYNYVDYRNDRLYATNIYKGVIDIYDLNGKKINTIDGNDITYSDCDLSIVRFGINKRIIDKDGNTVLSEDCYSKLQIISNDRAFISLVIENRILSSKNLIDLKNRKKLMYFPNDTIVDVLDEKTLITTHNNIVRLRDYDGNTIKKIGRCQYKSNKKGYAFIKGKKEISIINNQGMKINMSEDLVNKLSDYVGIVIRKDGSFEFEFKDGSYSLIVIKNDKAVEIPVKNSMNLDHPVLYHYINEKYAKIMSVVNNSEDKEQINALSFELFNNEYNDYFIGEDKKAGNKVICKTSDKDMIVLSKTDEVIPVDDNCLIINNCLYNINDINSKNIKTKLEVYDDDNNIKYSIVLDNDKDIEKYKKIISTEVYRRIELNDKIAFKKQEIIDRRHEKNNQIIMNNIDVIVEKAKRKIK